MSTSTALALRSPGAPLTEYRPRGAEVGAQTETDRRLESQIERALLATGHRVLHTVAVSARDRLVTLRGRVPSFYLKQLAQSVVLAAPGARGVRNELTVPERAEDRERTGYPE